MTFCSLTTVQLLLLIKAPPVNLRLLEYWNIVGFKGGSRQLKDFVASGSFVAGCARVVHVQNMAMAVRVHYGT